MIPFNFEYYKPETIEEAVDLFNSLKSAGKKPVYYGGGTEIISMARVHNVHMDAVIDIKGIPECNVHEVKDGKLIIGSGVTLTEIAELNFFPLLSLTIKRIADHTVQGKITLGGNLMGTIIYKEASLPLMASNSKVIIAGRNGKRKVLVRDIYDKEKGLNPCEMIVQIVVEDKFLNLPYAHVKRTKNEKIDYPLITIVGLKDEKKISFAFSGICEYPFRSPKMEDVLNNNSISVNKRIKKAITNIPGKILNDLNGSSEYRKFMLHTMLKEALLDFQEVE